MAWLFFLFGTVVNVQAWRKTGKGIPILPGLAGSIAAFFTVALLGVPWPWLWILLPLVLELALVLAVRRK